MLFASPNAIIDKPYWKRFVRLLVEKNLLRLVAVDEIQLYVHYGLPFRLQLAMISTTLFKNICDGVYSISIPVLFMTASCTYEMYDRL